MYRRLSKTTALTNKQKAILRFIARWKFVTRAMIVLNFGFNAKYVNEILIKLINQGLIFKVKSSAKTWGGLEYIYYISNKALKYFDERYIYISSPRLSYHLSEHGMTCLKIIKSLGLKDDDYLTEMELSIRYKALKEKLELVSKPRMCDFGYIDPISKKFIGVEVELHIKDRSTYRGMFFDPRAEQLLGISNQNKSKIRFGGYSIDKYDPAFYLVNTKEINLDLVKKDAQKQGINPETVKPVYRYKVYYIPEDEEKEWSTELYAFNSEHARQSFFEFNTTEGLEYGVSNTQPFKHKNHNFIRAELIHEGDGIIRKHYYALTKGFYNRIHWYLPYRYKRTFTNMMLEFYPKGLPKFYEIHTFDDQKQATVKKELLTYVKKTSRD